MGGFSTSAAGVKLKAAAQDNGLLIPKASFCVASVKTMHRAPYFFYMNLDKNLLGGGRLWVLLLLRGLLAISELLAETCAWHVSRVPRLYYPPLRFPLNELSLSSTEA